ncbi:DMQ mono-oxygenase/Ubiquinone biosynthesis protein COQ7/CLK-1/CAT5 [Spathaspora passalidarum NRRL Y-27907]|uniref:5-demethoxyubiquinone hydroxylase, mitochondrial n=1 Tax=Spathaspora passalidarum (strain NRRL Y-27907 / 11-Y1) TaxID=619300 RepID=G3AP03_SPAPN|nr:DMQ mono-oxygenase/Ubiquinone biosynthesis protein COQ7/CLK-1/CAT5 [Spathaspora passalidarum NRRL Y-27907]EGW32034.1 DMQ mono-oxygenase/Ubiquinone biosynthesis protein COQ7/CLK-1/CAT5 [Spathaspora passalidarum NRRL Y-27907]
MISRSIPKRQALASIRQLSNTSRLLQVTEQQDQPQDKKYTRDELTYGKLSPAQKAYLDRVIRVDQAGELGANYIYLGQILVLASRYPHLKPLLTHMREQEIHHHNTFNDLQVRRRVRPSLITPLWKVGAIGMGMGTALLSKEAAMACTVAVETVIGGHYNEQLRVLMNQYNVPIYDKQGKVVDKSEVTPTAIVSEELTSLKENIKLFRDQELEHLDIALENDAEKAVPYKLLTEGIKTVCKGAIWAAERI